MFLENFYNVKDNDEQRTQQLHRKSAAMLIVNPHGSLICGKYVLKALFHGKFEKFKEFFFQKVPIF